MIYGGHNRLNFHLCVVTEVKTTMTRHHAPATNMCINSSNVAIDRSALQPPTYGMKINKCICIKYAS